MTRKFGARFGGLGLVLVAPVALLAPGCKFESCADTNSCGSEEDDDSLGGQGGAGEMEEPDNTPDGTGGGEMEGGMGGDGAGPNGTGGNGTGADGTGANGTGGDEPVLSCEDGEVACDGECVDPLSDTEFCGAQGNCEDDDAGELCDEGEICVEGACELDCLEGEVACDGSCVDPLTNDDYCGADAECELFSACSELQQCIAGGCAGWGEAGSVNFGTGTSNFVEPGQLTIDGQGDVLFAWARRDADGIYEVKTSQLVVDAGLWSQPEVHSTSESVGSATLLATNSSGRSVLIWQQTVGNLTGVWASARDPGSGWADAVPLSGTAVGGGSDVPAHPHSLTLDEQGNAYVVWAEDHSLNQVMRGLKAGDTEWGEHMLFEIDVPKPWDFRGLHIKSFGDGEALVVVENGVPGDWTWYSAVSEDGVFGIAEPAFEATQAGASLSPVVASNEDEAVLFWVAGTDPATPLDFGMVSFFRDDVWSEPTYIRTPGTVAPLREPRIAIDAEGNITAAWVSGWDTSALWSASLEAGADEWIFQEEPVAVGIGEGSISELVLELDGLGNVQLAWIQTAGNADSVWAARRRAGSIDFDVPRVIEDWEAVPVSGLAMDFNDAGQGVITWWTTAPTERTLGFNTFR